MSDYIKDVFRRHKYLIGAFFIPFLLMETIAVIMKVEPFGNQSFLIVDALHQYLPFFADYQEKLQSADSLFYSFHGGLGYNFWGLWAYYLASPLNLIIVLCSKETLNMVLSHLFIIKIALCCFTSAFYFRKKRGRDEFSIIAFGMAYGFSSYIVGYSWNIMWMEVMILLPVILYGVDKLIKEHDGRLYCFALFLSLWSNFYMSYMTCLFLVLWYILYEHKNIKEFVKNGVRFAGYSLLSGAMAAVVLIPAYLGIMQTSSAKLEFPKNLWYGTFGDLFSRHFLGTTPLAMSVNDGEINLYCGILTVMMALFYLTLREIHWSVKIRRLVLLVLLFFSFNMPVLGYIWHGFHNQYGIPNRYAFLYIFLLLSMAYDGYCVLVRKGRRCAWKFYISCVLTGILIAVTILTAKNRPDWSAVYLTAAVTAVYTIIFLLYRKKVLRKKVFTTMICVMLSVEMAVMAVIGFKENDTVDVEEYFQDTKSVAQIKELYQNNISDRMELMSGRMLDESIWHTLNCMTLFGSTAQGNVVDMMDQMGFYTGVNEYLYEGCTPFTNQLFSVRYQIYRPQDSRLTPFRPLDTAGNVTVYKNLYHTGIAYGMDSEIKYWNYQDYNPFYVQNDLAKKAYGINGLFQMIETRRPELTDCEITSDNGEGEYVFKNTSARPDNMVFTIKSTVDRELYIHFDGSQVENTIIEKNGEQILTGRLNSQILYLGDIKAGVEIRIKLQLKQDDVMSGVVRLTAAQLNRNVMDRLAAEMETQTMEITKSESSRIEGSISMKKAGTLFFGIPYDKGWKVWVDGKRVKTKALGKAFLTTEIPKGNHTIVLSYTPPGFWIGALVSVVGFVIFSLLLYFFRKKKIRKLQRND